MVSRKSSQKNKGGFVLDEKTFSLIFEGHSAVMLLIEPETGVIRDANQAALNFYGYSKSKICSMSIGEINTLPPDLGMAERQKALNEERNYFVFPHKLASGEERIVEVHSSPITLQDKQLLVSIVHDITGHRLTEDALHHSQLFLNSIIEHSPNALWISDEHGTLIRMNQACRDNLHLRDEEVVGKYNILKDELLEAQGLMPQIKDVFEKGIHAHFVTSYNTAAIKNLDLEETIKTILDVNISPILNSHGKVSNAIIQHIDITEYQQVEDNLRRRTNELTSLQETILDISSPHSLFELLNLIVERAANLLDAASGGLYLTEPEQRQVRCVVSYNTKNDYTGTLLNFGDGAAGYVAETGKPLIVDDYRKWTGRANVYEEEQPFQAVMSAPMLWQGKVSGVIHLLREDISKKFTPEEMNLLLLFANHAAVAVENARLFKLFDQELSERGQTEDLLKTTRKNYETFFNSIEDFLFVLDGQGNIIHTNKTVTDRLGYSAEELLGQSVLVVHPPERRQEAGQIVGEMLAGRAEVCPVPLMKKSGEQIPVETRVTPGFWNDKPAIFGVTKDISQIKLSEEKFSKAFQSNSALMALSRFADGTYIDVNEIFLKTLGFKRDEVIGKNSTELSLFADPDQRNQVIEKLKQSGTVKDVEVAVRAKDGSLRDGLFSADIIYIGKDLCLLTVMLDITERKRTEGALRENQSLYHSLVEVSPLCICRKDLEGRFTFANQRFLESSQITLADLVGKDDFDLHPPDLAEKYRRDDRAIIDSGQVKELIEERITFDSEPIVIQSIKTPIYDGNGKVNGIQISFWDITERKRAEKALKESEERLREVLENSLDASYKRNLRTNTYDYFSPVSTRIFGYTQEEMKNLPLDVALDLTHPDDAPEIERVLTEALSGTVGKDYQIEYRFKHKDGQYYWIRDQFTVIRDEQGQPTALIGSVSDITERKRMEKALRESEEKYRTVANFTYDWEAWHAPDGTCLYISPSCERISGYTVEQFMADESLIVKIVHTEDKARVVEHFDLVRDPYQVHDSQLDFRIVTAGGDIRWISHHCTTVYGKDGECLGRRESNRDITDRKQAEQELQIQRDFATQIINTMGQGLTVTNSEGLFEFVNPAYARLFGYEAANLIGKRPRDLTVPEDQPFLDNQWGQRLVGKSSTYESRVSRPDGSVAHLLITGVPRERDGLYAGSIAVITDLTEQKQVEDELRHAKEELELANEKLEQAFAREQQLARTDSLTGVNSRGHLFELAERKFNVALRYRLPLSIILFDVDHFKQINDTFGHATGDQVLQCITRVVCSEIRSADVIGRYGGDEFVILLPQSNAKEAANLAKRIHASIAKIRMETDKGNFTIAVSLGISETIHSIDGESKTAFQADTMENLFLRADQALYAAKEAGRNRTVIFEE